METKYRSPRTVQEIFQAHKGRRQGMLRALITEVSKFYQLCDPESENLSLYSFPDGNWEAAKPADESPSELPEPCPGINFSRDSMCRKDWLSLVSAHSDSWLFAVAFYYAAPLDKQQRGRLFDMINELPTVHEVVTGQELVTQMRGSQECALHQEVDEVAPEENKDEEEEGREDETYCGACGVSYSSSKSRLWIFCESCRKWFHARCVRVTSAMANRIDKFQCPSCTKKIPHA